MSDDHDGLCDVWLFEMVKCCRIGPIVLTHPHDGVDVFLHAEGNSVRCSFGAKADRYPVSSG
jgi:hypothetical protein